MIKVFKGAWNTVLTCKGSDLYLAHWKNAQLSDYHLTFLPRNHIISITAVKECVYDKCGLREMIPYDDFIGG